MKPNGNYIDNYVSIITPVYNKEKFISQSIDSVISQSFTYWELILVDDCSTDGSVQVIERYAKRDDRIRLLKLAKNSGAAVARNAGLAAARGQLIAFLDADDVWNELKLEKQLHFMRSKQIGFSFTAIEMIDEQGSLVKGKRRVCETVDYRFLLSDTIIACSSVVIDRKIIGDVHMADVRKGQDYATWLSILRKGHCAYGIDEALVQYRLVNGSVSANKLGALRRTWHIYRTCEHLNLFQSLHYFLLYAFHAAVKYYF